MPSYKQMKKHELIDYIENLEVELQSERNDAEYWADEHSNAETIIMNLKEETRSYPKIATVEQELAFEDLVEKFKQKFNI